MSALHETGAETDLRRDILTTLLPGFSGMEAPTWLLRRLADGLGGVCVFGPNIRSVEQLRAMSTALRTANPLAIVAIDEEGGDVTRLFYDRGAPYPGNAVLGRVDDPELTARVARAVGEALLATGCTVTFAPDIDVNSNPDNPVIGVRSFGADPELVARHSAAWTRGLQETGIAASAKHFPGHGDTATDSHLALPVVDVPLETLRERELVPFRAAIAAGTRTIMTSHILLPQLDPDNPATLSPRILQGLLRGELGFDGVIVSDALDMHGASGTHGIPEAALRALAAGCDLLCIGFDNTDSQLDEIVAAVEHAIASGRLPAERVRDAARRVRELGGSAPPVSDLPALPPSIEPERDGHELARVIGAFEVSDAARTRLAGSARIGTVVRIDTVANIAVGVAPWGPFAAEALAGAPSWLGDAEVVTVSAERALAGPAALAGTVLVVGKDLHRHPFARAAIEALRTVRDDVVTIDLGWPSNDRAFADVATFGASRLLGEAVVEFVAASLTPPPSVAEVS
ncbi:glycoside hydrolase family 3 protein [Agromyces sp. ISL-38]|uniref:glycoside hydrolase family 3 protein n=1 Tax=Agromyces sp. ISL-38 TaxID=2819107 RepID=UPI001BE9970D|nr:glycoside hydrolase family 3 protein [Agromyces sp. ISL-38]MBT2498224.1 glycoside hydrolase family 3 protein [Agromyces sp. ISL-38]MBT2518626.1 glycoside hydrolase family 3 protein [Streptomyces sp. ISL-90]